MKQKVVCLYGGRSGEHEVSLMSAAAVIKHMNADLWEPVGIGIDYDGTWYLQDREDLFPESGKLVIRRDRERIVTVIPGSGLSSEGRPLDCACVLPVLHGTFGEDGTIQGLMEIADLPYAGPGVLAASLGMDKEMTKQVWFRENLPVVPFLGADAGDIARDSGSALVKRIENGFGFPVFVKPVRLGSSVGVGRASSPAQLGGAMKEALRYDTRIIIEPEIEGREIECAVLGNRNPVAYGPGEVAPSHDFYSYEAKYIDPEGAALYIPADLQESESQEIRDLAVRAFTAVRGSGLSRVDFFLENKTGRILLNEINTIPGFTGISMFPLLCVNGGLSFRDLVSELIRLGIERFTEKSNLQFRREK